MYPAPDSNRVSIAGLVGVSSYGLSGLGVEREPTGPWANWKKVTSGRGVFPGHCGRARKPNNLSVA